MSNRVNSWQQAVCPFCGCLCEDLLVKMDGQRFSPLSVSCRKALAGFERHNGVPGLPEQEGTPLTFPEALRTAAQWIAGARLPLILPGEGASLEACRAVVRLAQTISACVDVPGPLPGDGVARAAAGMGDQSCSLGLLRDRADRVVFWGASPEQSHPRFLERFIAPGCEKTLLAVNSVLPDTLPVEHYSVDAAAVLGLISGLLLGLKQGNDALEPLAARLLSGLGAARAGVFVLGDGFLRQGEAVLAELFRLMKALEIRHGARWFALMLAEADHFIANSAALLAETAFPGSMRFRDGRAEYSPAEWGAEALLRQGGADLVICAGSPQNGWKWPGGVRTIVLSADHPDGKPGLWFPVGQPGWDCTGTLVRLDGVPVWVSGLEPGKRPSLEDALDQVRQAVLL